jgi:hypothetical protein
VEMRSAFGQLELPRPESNGFIEVPPPPLPDSTPARLERPAVSDPSPPIPWIGERDPKRPVAQEVEAVRGLCATSPLGVLPRCPRAP